MYEMILLCLALVLSMMGIAGLFARIWLFLFRPKTLAHPTALIWLDGDEDEKQVTYYLEKYKWYGEDFARNLVFVGREKPSYAIRCIAKDFNNVYFGSAEELSKLTCAVRENEWKKER